MNTKFFKEKFSGVKLGWLRNMGGNSSSKRIPAEKGDTKGKCLICHPNGVVIACTVFRCSVCSHCSDSVDESRKHYDKKHLARSRLQNTLTDFEPVVIPLTKAINKNLHLNNNIESIFRTSTPCSESLNDDPDPTVNLCPSPEAYASMERSHYPLSKDGVKYSSKLSIGANCKPTQICCICRVPRQFSCIQKRLGKYVCVQCFRALKHFLANPRVCACSDLGNCSLNEKIKCDACWTKACIDTYMSELDEEKQAVLRKYYPVKRGKASSVKGTSKLNLRESFCARDSSVLDLNGCFDEVVDEIKKHDAIQRRLSLQDASPAEVERSEEKENNEEKEKGGPPPQPRKKVFTSPSSIWKALISN